MRLLTAVSRSVSVGHGYIRSSAGNQSTRRRQEKLKARVPPVDSQSETEYNQRIREGHTETEYVKKQESKGRETGQSLGKLSQSLSPWSATKTADVAVVGCGPAGMVLAAECAKRGLGVVLIGEDVPFVNNYGVWVDEFEELGFASSLDIIWPNTACFFGEQQEVNIDRRYGRVDLVKLRELLTQQCRDAGVAFYEGFVENIDTSFDPNEARLTCMNDTTTIKTRLVTLASGAAAGKFLKFESGVPSPGAQTAYGIEVQIEEYAQCYPDNKMLFMDYRRHHTGLWPGTALRIKPGQHPDGGDGLWSSHGEVPSFLYAMPLASDRVFFEETCLVAKPPLPFAQLKRRLSRRIEAMGLDVKRVLDEEWSYIPVGGPLPIEDQEVTAFGSAANLIHPASGYSISRSLREAPAMACAIQSAIASQKTVLEMSRQVWSILWTQEKRAQASFHIFGMELLAKLELSQVNGFFTTFFKLPSYYWKGFLSASIGSTDLLVFAILTFILAPIDIKTSLISHLITDPCSGYMMKRYRHKYLTEIREWGESRPTGVPAFDES